MIPVLLTDMGEDLEERCKEEFQKFLGKRIKRAMAEKEMDVKELSVKSRINKYTLYRYISGNGMPSMYNIYKIAIVLDKKIDYFF